MKKILFVVLLMLMMLQVAKADEFSADVENNQVVVGEPFELRLSYSGDDNNVQPDLSVLNSDFRVYSNGTSVQTSYINGVVNQRREWIIGLVALKEGKVQIPAIKAGNLSANAIDLDVLPAGSSVSSDNNNATKKNAVNAPKFELEFEVDNKNPYIKQEVKATLIIKDYIGLEFAGEPNFVNDEDWKIKIIGQPEVSKISGGREIKLNFAMFALKSGELELPNLQWQAYYFDVASTPANSRGFGFFDMSGFSLMQGVQKPVILQSEKQKINIKPIPEEYGTKWWLPAKALTLGNKWAKENSEFKVGEAVTREIILSAAGVLDSELPDLEFVAPKNMKQYPENPQYSLNFYQDEPIAQATYRIVYIPQKSGDNILPEIKLRWFNTRKNEVETATIPSQTINVEPNPTYSEVPVADEPKAEQKQGQNEAVSEKKALPQTTHQTPEDKGGNFVWFTLAAFVFGMLLSYLLFARRTSEDNKSKTLKNIDKYLKNNDYRRLRDSLLKWGNETHPTVSVNNLNDLSLLLGTEDFARQMQILNRIIYTETEEKLDSEIITTSLKNHLKQKNAKDKKPLPELYS